MSDEIIRTHLNFAIIECPSCKHNYTTVVVFVGKEGLYCGECGERLQYIKEKEQ